MERENARLIRLHSDSLDSILGDKYSVLNDWLIRVIDYLETDDPIVLPARFLCGKGKKIE